MVLTVTQTNRQSNKSTPLKQYHPRYVGGNKLENLINSPVIREGSQSVFETLHAVKVFVLYLNFS